MGFGGCIEWISRSTPCEECREGLRGGCAAPMARTAASKHCLAVPWEEEEDIPCGEVDFVAQYEEGLEEEAAAEASAAAAEGEGEGSESDASEASEGEYALACP